MTSCVSVLISSFGHIANLSFFLPKFSFFFLLFSFFLETMSLFLLHYSLFCQSIVIEISYFIKIIIYYWAKSYIYFLFTHQLNKTALVPHTLQHIILKNAFNLQEIP